MDAARFNGVCQRFLPLEAYLVPLLLIRESLPLAVNSKNYAGSVTCLALNLARIHPWESARAIPYDWRIWDERLDSESLRSLTAPTLLILGTETLDWIRAGAQTVLKAISGAQKSELAGQGHSAMITAPELFAETVEQFAKRA